MHLESYVKLNVGKCLFVFIDSWFIVSAHIFMTELCYISIILNHDCDSTGILKLYRQNSSQEFAVQAAFYCLKGAHWLCCYLVVAVFH